MSWRPGPSASASTTASSGASSPLLVSPVDMGWGDRELCPSADEPAWALNVKRGILSAFQATSHTTRANSRIYEVRIPPP